MNAGGSPKGALWGASLRHLIRSKISKGWGRDSLACLVGVVLLVIRAGRCRRLLLRILCGILVWNLRIIPQLLCPARCLHGSLRCWVLILAEPEGGEGGKKGILRDLIICCLPCLTTGNDGRLSSPMLCPASGGRSGKDHECLYESHTPSRLSEAMSL